MKNQILDDDFTQKHPKKEINNIRLHALTAVITMAFAYLFIYLVFFESIEFSSRVMKVVVEDSASILHLVMAMTFFNYSVAEGDYKLNIKGGYYILLFGSGLFLIGASISLFDEIFEWIEKEGTYNFWSANYKHFITLIVIFVKFLLIKPIALILIKTKRHIQ